MQTQMEMHDIMEDMLKAMVNDYNSYSELVALNYEQKKEGRVDDSTLQWNRGHLSQIDVYMRTLAEKMEVGLRYECKSHIFGRDEWQRTLEYRTVEIVPLRRLNAEWIPYMKAYRLYDPKKPQSTVAFVDDLIEMMDTGTKIVEVDADTMHVECF